MSVEWNKKQWVIHTREYGGSTYAIGLSFVFLAYFLHPAVEAAFRRVRAYRGWLAVESGQTVEVTTYPLVEEVCSGRRRWDTARVVTVLQAAFSLASWGLELQLGLAFIDGIVTDLFFRPPPVWTNPESGTWNVISPEKLNIKLNDDVNNTFGNFSVGTANARYEVNNNTDAIISGAVEVASWSNSLDDLTIQLSYHEGHGIAHVESGNCSQNATLLVEGVDEPWGTVLNCDSGLLEGNGTIAPALKLHQTDGETYFIVEESVTYPSFFYAVWVGKNDDTTSLIEMRFVFYISSSARLAEAVVTEIVHASLKGKTPTGGGSFALLREFSENNPTYGAIDLQQRASPFGEHPLGKQPSAQLSTIETIEKGVTLNPIALVCAVWIIASALVGIVWSLLLRSRIGMDIYDRDELIRAVTAPASVDDNEHSSKMRIFVRKEENGNISVAVSDFERHQSGCPQSFRSHDTVAIDVPLPVSTPYRDHDFGGAVVPPERTVWLEGVRTGRARIYPGREGNYRYPTSIALVASPVPSCVGSTAGTPVSLLASSADAPPPNRPLKAIDPRLFDSVNSLGESAGHDGNVEMRRDHGEGGPEAEPYKTSGPLSPPPSESRITEMIDLRGLRFHSDSTATLNDRKSTSPYGGRTPMPASRSPARSRRSTADPEETKNDPNAHCEAKEEAGTEHGGVHDGVHGRRNELV